MRYNEAKYKLERELHNAFMEGETYVEILHGIGEEKLKKMTVEFIKSCNFLKLIDNDAFFIPNPGITKVEIIGLSKAEIKKIRKK